MTLDELLKINFDLKDLSLELRYATYEDRWRKEEIISRNIFDEKLKDIKGWLSYEVIRLEKGCYPDGTEYLAIFIKIN